VSFYTIHWQIWSREIWINNTRRATQKSSADSPSLWSGMLVITRRSYMANRLFKPAWIHPTTLLRKPRSKYRIWSTERDLQRLNKMLSEPLKVFWFYQELKKWNKCGGDAKFIAKFYERDSHGETVHSRRRSDFALLYIVTLEAPCFVVPCVSFHNDPSHCQDRKCKVNLPGWRLSVLWQIKLVSGRHYVLRSIYGDSRLNSKGAGG
jgi:hypothetical protein